MDSDFQADGGLSFLESQTPALDAVILLVCDQPFITAQLIDQLIDTHQATDKAIVATAYANTIGVPALFSRSLFPSLRALTKAGAKSVISRYRDQTVSVPFPKGEIDIDTPADAEWMGSLPAPRHPAS